MHFDCSCGLLLNGCEAPNSVGVFTDCSVACKESCLCHVDQGHSVPSLLVKISVVDFLLCLLVGLKVCKGTQKFDFIVVNYANGDMVGHTGIYPAIEKAVVAIDECVKDTVEAAKANDYEVIIIADHGNADNALNQDGSVNTAHSLNPVPFVYVTANKDAKVEDGVLADVAPSILHILGLPQPAEMDGKDLIKN